MVNTKIFSILVFCICPWVSLSLNKTGSIKHAGVTNRGQLRVAEGPAEIFQTALVTVQIKCSWTQSVSKMLHYVSCKEMTVKVPEAIKVSVFSIMVTSRQGRGCWLEWKMLKIH